jgi:hypothetical protein
MIKETLKKAAGLFVEFDPESATARVPEASPAEEWNVMTATGPEPVVKTKTVEQIVKEQPGPNLDEIRVQTEPASPSEPVIRADGSICYDSIYRLAQLPTVPFTAEQILEMLATLPPDQPLDSKRASIRVMLGAMAKNMGVTTEQIVADASRKLAALAAYNESFAKQADEYVSRTELEILGLEQQIADKRRAMEDAKAKQAKMTAACSGEADRLDDVLEFFSLDIAPSKHA